MGNRFKIFLFILSTLILTVCGQIEVGIENQPTPTPLPTDVILVPETDINEVLVRDLKPDLEPNNDFCQEEWEVGSPEKFACRLIEYLAEKQLEGLANLMADPFTLISSGQGGGGGREDSPEQAVGVLYESFLPPNQEAMFFSIDPNQDQTLPGPPGTTGKPILILLGDGWGQEGQRTANLFITQNESGEYVWYGIHINRLEEVSGTIEKIQGLVCPGGASPAESLACTLIDSLVSHQETTLQQLMGDPFTLAYWGSESRMDTPSGILNELYQTRLPTNSLNDITFTTDRSQFPPLQGIPPETMFGPEVNIALIIYSEGWGEDGQGAALLYIAQNDAGDYYWHSMVFSFQHFDK